VKNEEEENIQDFFVHSHVYHSFRLSNSNHNDHSRRLIQTAYVRFQQLNECDDLNGEQKQWIQTWMDAVSNVR
jgi:hypothetical protein